MKIHPLLAYIRHKGDGRNEAPSSTAALLSKGTLESNCSFLSSLQLLMDVNREYKNERCSCTERKNLTPGEKMHPATQSPFEIEKAYTERQHLQGHLCPRWKKHTPITSTQARLTPWYSVSLGLHYVTCDKSFLSKKDPYEKQLQRTESISCSCMNNEWLLRLSPVNRFTFIYTQAWQRHPSFSSIMHNA